MNNYVVMGSGNSSAGIIEDSLADLPSPRTFHIVAEKTSKEGPCRVYDWLLDNGEKFVSYHNNSAPTVLIDSASRTVTSQEPSVDLEDVAVAGKMTVLYLFDDSSDSRDNIKVISLLDRGVNVLDLTQGLTPFLIEDDVVNDTVDSIPPITRKEYEEMPLKELRQQAKAHGAQQETFVSKDDIIDFLVSTSEPEEVWEDDAVVVIVVHKNQKTQTFKSTATQIKTLFQN